MAFNIGLSGLRAASTDLNVKGNNIANASTVGFKSSRAEFADVYSASVLGSASNQAGSGVFTSSVSQKFTQGNISFTDNSLDMAINGNGFFVLNNGGEISYSRAGYMGTDKDGFVVNNAGKNLQGYGVDANGKVVEGVMTDLKIETANQDPKETDLISQQLNLNSTDAVPTVTPFDPLDPDSYNSATSVNIFDSQGNSHIMTQYFVKTGSNTWDMRTMIDGRDPGAVPPVVTAAATESVSQLVFDAQGALDATTGINGAPPAFFDPLATNAWTPRDSAGVLNGATTTGFNMDLVGTTQFSSGFAVTSVSQDGYATGQLAGMEINDEGFMFARYTNGQSKVQGQVVFANFANAQGLSAQGQSEWAESFGSGEPVIGVPRSGTMGALQAGAVEESNVDLSNELVGLIISQRNYQANAKTIETSDRVTQAILNI